MRLINVDTYELAEFAGDNIPEYAILSHTWAEEEVLFQDMRDRRSANAARKKKGFNKIRYCCKQAKEDGWSWAWVDTCCIDKSSSAELSEAINSMYGYYATSMVCYAYLGDTEDLSKLGNLAKMCRTERKRAADLGEECAALGLLSGTDGCRWFARGWTLQELIAPFHVEFYSHSWELLGAKSDLAEILADITGIDSGVLQHRLEPSHMSVATRMHWASSRQTTRIEDMAYCLMGIFNVNMPLLYGEGQRAFRRLQEEILKVSNDQTIFLWGSHPQKNELAVDGRRVFSSKSFSTGRQGKYFVDRVEIFAPDVASFSTTPRFQPRSTTNQFSDTRSIESHQGIQIRMPMKKIGMEDRNRFEKLNDSPYRVLMGHVFNSRNTTTYLGILNCTVSVTDNMKEEPENVDLARLGVAIILERYIKSSQETEVPVVFRYTHCFHFIDESEWSQWEWRTCVISGGPGAREILLAPARLLPTCTMGYGLSCVSRSPFPESTPRSPIIQTMHSIVNAMTIPARRRSATNAIYTLQKAGAPQLCLWLEVSGRRIEYGMMVENGDIDGFLTLPRTSLAEHREISNRIGPLFQEEYSPLEGVEAILTVIRKRQGSKDVLEPLIRLIPK